MNRELPLTFRGALAILGRHERPWLDKLNAAFGGAILTAGVGLAASGAGVPLFGVAVLAALWGAIDQKNEAMALLRSRLDRLADRRLGPLAYERAELIAAAHTTVAVAAYFEVLHERLNAAGLPSLKLLRSEIVGIASRGRADDTTDGLDRWFVTSEVPAPSAVLGFRENIDLVGSFYVALGARVRQFLAPLSGGDAAGALLDDDLLSAALARYESAYLRLATTVPEFFVWASLGEHAATRTDMAEAQAEVAAALAGQTRTLNRLEALLGLVLGAAGEPDDQRASLAQSNRLVLDKPVMHRESQPTAGAVRFPLLRDAFLNPRYRIAIAAGTFHPADDGWWAKVAVRADLDLGLTAHLLTADATRRPLLLLGHPGAGKSMLTKVLAARLPADGYMVVRVPLRSVAANARILVQIQSALDIATNDAVDWRTLARQSAGTTRVVLLDGLDELLQATPDDRTGYLHDVADFQEREAANGCPVVVVVTSRTIVADRVEIPAGTIMIKLENFDEDQIAAWLDIWAAANAEGIAAGTVRPLPLPVALGQQELARQPLLLLMLALYVADPSTPQLEAGVSTTELYRRLFNVFAHREIDNRPQPPKPPDRDRAVRRQLDRLSIAALAMFNRGRQDVADAELAADLAGLGLTGGAEPDAEAGARLLGEFFFVHVAEAVSRNAARRSYEFLHATFGEYLVAHRIVDVLAETAYVAYASPYGTRRPDDDQLFALLRYQSLAARQPALAFTCDLMRALPPDDRERIAALLGKLLSGYRQRETRNAFDQYRPLPVDHARELAAYSANLALLRVSADPPVALTDLFPDAEDPAQSWRSTVDLWLAALDGDSWHTTVLALHRNGDTIALASPQPDLSFATVEVAHALLVGDTELARALRLGLAIVADRPAQSWGEDVAASLLPPLLNWANRKDFAVKVPATADGIPDAEVLQAVNLLWCLFDVHGVAMTAADWLGLIRWIVRVTPADRLNLADLAWLVALQPEILDDDSPLAAPAFWDRSLFGRLLLRACSHMDGRVAKLVGALRFDDVPDELRNLAPATLDAVVMRLREMIVGRMLPRYNEYLNIEFMTYEWGDHR